MPAFDFDNSQSPQSAKGASEQGAADQGATSNQDGSVRNAHPDQPGVPPHAQFNRQLQQYVDGELSPEDVAHLERQLRHNKVARQLLVDFCESNTVTQLAELDLEATTAAPVTTRGSWRCPNLWAAIGAVLLIVGTIVFWQLGMPHNTPFLSSSVGEIRVDRGPLQPLSAIAINSRLETGANSSAEIAYADGTVINITENSQVRFPKQPETNCIRLLRGHLDIRTAANDLALPTCVVLPHSSVQTTSAELSITSKPSSSTIVVQRGEANLTGANADSEPVHLTAGQAARVTATGTILAPSLMPRQTDSWAEAFRSELPLDWRVGTWHRKGNVDDHDPEDGFVRAALRPNGFYTIMSPKPWQRGLAVVRSTSVLRLRLRIARPGFFHILLGCRRPDFQPNPASGNFEYQLLNAGDLQPHVWHDLAIPLTDFRHTEPPPEYRDAPFHKRPAGGPQAGDVVYFLAISSQHVDRQLELDSLSIDSSDTRLKAE